MLLCTTAERAEMSAVSLASIPVAAVVIGLFLLAALALVKPLNAFLLGELYAENLGYDTRKLRLLLLLVTGVLTATVTAFCGPIAFIGLATPHIARRPDNLSHRPAVQLALRPSHPERHDSPRSSHPTSWCPRHHLRAAEKEVGGRGVKGQQPFRCRGWDFMTCGAHLWKLSSLQVQFESVFKYSNLSCWDLKVNG